MGLALSEKWKAAMEQSIAKFPENPTDADHIEVRTTYSVVKQWLIFRLSESKIPFRVLQLGCGVALITTKTDLCPKCKGSGRI